MTSLEYNALDELSNLASTNLERLNIAGCPKMSDDSKFIQFPIWFWKIKLFDIIFFFLFSVLEKIVNRCPQLFELDLSDCTGLTPKAINALATLVNIDHLSITHCNINSLDDVRFLCHRTNLGFLDIFHLDRNFIKILKDIFPKIKYNKYRLPSTARPTLDGSNKI